MGVWRGCGHTAKTRLTMERRSGESRDLQGGWRRERSTTAPLKEYAKKKIVLWTE